MNCKNTTTCTQKNCGCPVPNLSARCVVYDGETLSCIGANTPDNLNNLLKKFDKAICEKLNTVLQKGDLVNIGNGIELYEGTNNLGQREIKTLVSSDNSVIIEANTDNETIDIKVDLPDATESLFEIPNPSSYNPTIKSKISGDALGNGQIVIGRDASAVAGSTSNGIAIGTSSEISTSEYGAIAIGPLSNSSYGSSIALGAGSKTFRTKEVSLSTTDSQTSSNNRYVAGVENPRFAYDAANKYYVDNAIAAIPDFPEIPYIPKIKHVGSGENIVLGQNTDQDYEVSGIKTLDGSGSPDANGTVSVYAGYNNTNKSHEFRNISGGTEIEVENTPSGEIKVSSLYQHEQSDFTEEDSQQEGFIKNRLPSKTVTADYSLTEQDNLHVIVVDTTSNDITITYDSNISLTEYFVGFVQKGRNNVTFVGHNFTPQDRVPVLYGEGHNAAIEKLQGDVFLFGSLKQ